MSPPPRITAASVPAPDAPAAPAPLDARALDGIDRALRLIAHALNAPAVIVARTDERQRVVACRSHLFDAWAAMEGTPALRSLGEHVAAAADPRLPARSGSDGEIPLVRGRYGMDEFGLVDYGALPLVLAGAMAGVLCIADRRRRDWGGRHEQMLRDFAGMVAGEIECFELRRRLSAAPAAAGAGPARFRPIIPSAGEMIVILSADGTVIYGSPSGERLLGYADGERVGRNALELVHPEDARHVASALAQVTQRPGSAVHVTYRCRHKDGSWRTLASTGTSLSRGPAAGGIVVHSRDVTGRRVSEEQLRGVRRPAVP